MTTVTNAVVIPAQRVAAESATWATVQRAQAGDTAAFGELYERYQKQVRTFITFRVGLANHALAEDLTHDTFVRALRSIGNFQWKGREYGAMLITIARNLVTDYYKSGRYRLDVLVPAVLQGSGNEELELRVDPDRPDQMAVDNDLAAALRAAVDRLGGEQRTCVQLRFYEGLSVAETAVAMGKEVGAVKAMQYRATRTLLRENPGLEAWR